MTTIGLFHSTIRTEEKLIIAATRRRQVNIKLIDIRNQIFNPATFKVNFDLALIRSMSSTKGLYATRFLESLKIPVLNSSHTSSLCQDKFLTSQALLSASVPTPKFALVFDVKQAKQAVDDLGGFPLVIKPVVGSWGRLLAKINDIDALEAVIEHKNVLGSPQQKVFYLQQYIKKPGRDIRSFVVGNKTICAIYRTSDHWITNTALGGQASNCPITPDLDQISQKAAKAVGGGILAIDIFETDSGLSINEINHSMEFRNSETPTKTDISGAIVDYCLKNIND